MFSKKIPPALRFAPRRRRSFGWKTLGTRYKNSAILKFRNHPVEGGEEEEAKAPPLKRRFVNFGVIEPWPSSGTMVKEGALSSSLRKTIASSVSSARRVSKEVREDNEGEILSFFYSSLSLIAEFHWDSSWRKKFPRPSIEEKFRYIEIFFLSFSFSRISSRQCASPQSITSFWVILSLSLSRVWMGLFEQSDETAVEKWSGRL